MSKVFLLGNSPPLFYPGIKTEAANYRTWQFIEPLVQEGYKVCLCVDDHEITDQQPIIPKEWSEQITYKPIYFGRLGWSNELQRVYDNYSPDCVVAVNFYPCLYASKLKNNKPIWMDIYGDMLTIVQAANHRKSSNRGMPTTIYHLQQILQKGDIFSVCGVPQQHMLVGELAMVGRLNFQNFGYEFVHTILPGAAQLNVNINNRGGRPLLSKLGIDNEDFIVLWAGGYNTWTDIDTLFVGLQMAMSQDPKIHFVSLGANTYEAPDNVYTRFLDLIGNSVYQERFHMLGWRPWEEIPKYYLECDVGLNIDALHYETIYGTRTRLLEMIAAGLPVITTLGSELSFRMQEAGVALTFEIGHSNILSEHILDLSSNRKKCKSLSERTYRYACEDMSFFTTTKALREWIQSPAFAPDNNIHSLRSQFQEFTHHGRKVLRQILWKLAGIAK